MVLAYLCSWAGQMQVESSSLTFCLLHHAPGWLCATWHFMTVKALPEGRLPNFLMDTLMPFTLMSHLDIKNYYSFIGKQVSLREKN